MKQFFFLIFVFTAIFISGCKDNNPTDPDNDPEIPAGYQLVWSDEFNYIGLPDASKWSYDVGGRGCGESEAQN